MKKIAFVLYLLLSVTFMSEAQNIQKTNFWVQECADLLQGTLIFKGSDSIIIYHYTLPEHFTVSLMKEGIDLSVLRYTDVSVSKDWEYMVMGDGQLTLTIFIQVIRTLVGIMYWKDSEGVQNIIFTY